MIRNVYFRSDYYNLKIKHKEDQTIINMDIIGDILTTKQLPLTTKILNQVLPNIFNCQCFNNDELTFKREVKNTELGHLFEHILLEYLCRFKIESGYKTARYRGETSWDWKKFKKGIFDIDVSISNREKSIFYRALEKSIILINLIFQSNELLSYKNCINVYKNSSNLYKNNWYSQL